MGPGQMQLTVIPSRPRCRRGRDRRAAAPCTHGSDDLADLCVIGDIQGPGHGTLTDRVDDCCRVFQTPIGD
ncbi:hypothetical protein MASB_20810 [Mycobacteroides abscessus subsp. bolletii BD]|nr:hypothetical protein MASB_20810 [Mycobacteroides abscessus subsp. bolletii BD]